MGLPDNSQPTVIAAQTGFMNKVYLWMAFGLFTTAYTGYLVTQSPVLLDIIFGNRLVFWGLVLVELALVFTISGLMQRISSFVATTLFFVYALVNGLTISVIFLAYTQQSIMTTFAVTGGMFAGLSLYGYLTKRDLSAMGVFFVSALIGLILGMVVNIFLHNSILELFMTVAGVVIFSGLTAYDTQKIKQIGLSGIGDSETYAKAAIYGALALYLDFINLFLNLLDLMGRRR